LLLNASVMDRCPGSSSQKNARTTVSKFGFVAAGVGAGAAVRLKKRIFARDSSVVRPADCSALSRTRQRGRLRSDQTFVVGVSQTHCTAGCISASHTSDLSTISISFGGDGGIRTLDRPLQAYNGLANRRLQPLGHVSVTGRYARRGGEPQARHIAIYKVCGGCGKSARGARRDRVENATPALR
jgi:hypothetical protein